MPALLVSPVVTDRWGYRRTTAAGLCVALAGALVFAFADATAWLFAARVLQGVAIGLCSGALTATLARTDPAGNTRRAGLVTSTATTAGGGLGPVLAGVMASSLPAPARLCYLAEAGVLALALVGSRWLPAGLGRTRDRRHGIRRPGAPAGHRRAFLLACAVSFIAWAVTAVFLSIMPSYVRSLTHSGSLIIAGLASGLVLLVAAVTQQPAARIDEATGQRAGLATMALGLVVLLAAGRTHLLALVIASAVIAGSGQGLAFMGAVRTVNAATSPGEHASVLACFYLATYLGVGIPVIGVGLIATSSGAATAVNIFAILALAAAVAIAGVHPSRTTSHAGSPRCGAGPGGRR